MKYAHRLVGTATGDNMDGSSNIIPTLDPKGLQQGYEEILKAIYFPRAVLPRTAYFPKRVSRSAGTHTADFGMNLGRRTGRKDHPIFIAPTANCGSLIGCQYRMRLQR